MFIWPFWQIGFHNALVKKLLFIIRTIVSGARDRSVIAHSRFAEMVRILKNCGFYGIPVADTWT